MKIYKHLPNLLTLSNLFLGCVALVMALKYNNLMAVPFLIWAATIADFMDGLVARVLKVNSLLGVQLDSLADMVSFGVIPGLTAYLLLEITFKNSLYSSYIPFLGFLITLFSALRLANFNIDTRQIDGFIGLPTPANTLFWTSLLLIINNPKYTFWSNLVLNKVTLLILIPLSCFLLVCKLPIFALKFKHFGFKGNEIKFLYLFITVLLIPFFGWLTLSASIILYVLMAFLNNLINKPLTQ